MISHREIMRRLAHAVAADLTVLEYCVKHFDRGLDVHVGAYPDGIPGTEDSPFLWITPEEQNEDVDTDTVFTVRLVVAGAVLGEDGERVIQNVEIERGANANGVTVNGGNEIVEKLRDIILGVARNAKAGAIVSKIRRDENDIAHFPLEWAVAHIDYFEPEAL